MNNDERFKLIELAKKTSGKKYEERSKAYKDKFNKFNGDRFELISDYGNMTTPVLIRCKKCLSEGWKLPLSYSNGQRKCKCMGIHPAYHTTKTKWINEFPLKHIDFEIVGEYSGNKDPIKLRHKICGGIFEKSPITFDRNPFCYICNDGSNGKMTNKEFIEEMSKLYKSEFLILGKYTGIRDEVLIKHKQCGSLINVTPYTLLRGKFNCTTCNSKYHLGKPRKITEEMFKSKLKLYTNDEYELISEFKIQTSVLLKHKECGSTVKVDTDSITKNAFNRLKCKKCEDIDNNKKYLNLINFLTKGDMKLGQLSNSDLISITNKRQVMLGISDSIAMESAKTVKADLISKDPEYKNARVKKINLPFDNIRLIFENFNIYRNLEILDVTILRRYTESLFHGEILMSINTRDNGVNNVLNLVCLHNTESNYRMTTINDTTSYDNKKKLVIISTIKQILEKINKFSITDTVYSSESRHIVNDNTINNEHEVLYKILEVDLNKKLYLRDIKSPYRPKKKIRAKFSVRGHNRIYSKDKATWIKSYNKGLQYSREIIKDYIFKK